MGPQPRSDQDIWNGQTLAHQSMRDVHAEEPREDERPANGLRWEGKVAFNRRYIGSIHKFHHWMYEGGQAGLILKPRQRSYTSLPALTLLARSLRRTKSPRSFEATTP